MPPKVLGSSLVGSAGSGTGGSLMSTTRYFPFTSDALEIVPLKFRRLHAVADENHVGVHRGSFRHALGPGDEIVLKFRFESFSVPRQRELHSVIRSDADERNALQVSAIRIAGLQARRAKLVFEIFDRELLAFGARTASFKFIRGEDADVVRECDRRKTTEPARRGRTRPARTAGQHGD